MPKLNQIIAIEKTTKQRVYGEITELHKSSQKPELFNGFIKVYGKKDEEGEDFPTEKKKVQLIAIEILQKVRKLHTELIDLTYRKDLANCMAKADIVLDGQVIAEDVPATHLLFLEKQFTDLHTFIDKLPVLDEADDWARDESGGLFKTQPVSTQRTKKTARPIVLYAATKEHPAQTQLITEDIIIGYWDTVKFSGAMPQPLKSALLERVEKLQAAIKAAREQANEQLAVDAEIAQKLFDYIFR